MMVTVVFAITVMGTVALTTASARLTVAVAAAVQGTRTVQVAVTVVVTVMMAAADALDSPGRNGDRFTDSTSRSSRQKEDKDSD